MDSMFNISIGHCEWNLKFNKKIVRGQMLWVSFNVALLLFDWQNFNMNPSSLTAWGFGAMAITVLWSSVFLLECWSDLRRDRQKLNHLTKLRDEQMASSEREQYLQMKNHYERLIHRLKEKQNDSGIQQCTGSEA
jgi:hypothetical protein